MKKIDIRDLSIGDWVRVRMCKWDYDDPDTLDAKVLSIEGNSVGVGYDNSGIVMSAFVDDLQPVPITAEVLEKNGWWKIPYSDKIYTIEGDNYSLVYYIEGNVADFRRESDRCSITCNYIHELQRALRLAKVGKEIVL